MLGRCIMQNFEGWQHQFEPSKICVFSKKLFSNLNFSNVCQVYVDCKHSIHVFLLHMLNNTAATSTVAQGFLRRYLGISPTGFAALEILHAMIQVKNAFPPCCFRITRVTADRNPYITCKFLIRKPELG